MDRLLTIPEVAEILGISRSTAKIWASRRKFPVIKMGRLIRVSPQELREWMRRNTEVNRGEEYDRVTKATKSRGFEHYVNRIKGSS